MSRTVQRTRPAGKPNGCLIAFGIVAGLLLFGVAKFTYDFAKGPERAIALARSCKLADGRTLEGAMQAAYGPGKWEATQNKVGFIVSYRVPNLPEYGAGRPPSFWVELKPQDVGPYMSSGDICEQVGIRFR